MAPPEKPSRLGRGLDALLARKEPAKSTPEARSAAAEPAVAAPAASSAANAAEAAQTPASPAAAAPTGERRAETRPPTSTESPASPYAATPASVPAVDTVPKDTRRSGYQMLPIAHIGANRFQPRKEFREEDLRDLEASLRAEGLLQPITVRPAPEHTGYELIAGERRLRAAKRLGWTEIPAIVRETSDRAMITLAMVENLQRADLDPIEEADGYQRMIDDFDLTQQEVADVVGKDRSTVANALRLLALPASVKRMLQDRHITVGHARAMLPLETERAIADMARDVVAKSLSVRDVELKVRNSRPNPAKSGRTLKPETASPAAVGSSASNAEQRRMEELLRKKFQTTVTLNLSGKEKGEIRINFFSNDDLERVLELLGIDLD